jgi:uncharacterized membrane protein YvbJ
MPICTHCGENNPDGTARCARCGVNLGAQARAKQDAKQLVVWAVIRKITAVIALVIVACLIMPAYKASFTAYYRYRLNTVKEAANKSCHESQQTSQGAELDKCLAADDNLTKAQADYDNFLKTNRPQ